MKLMNEISLFLYFYRLKKKKIIFVIGKNGYKTKENYIINNGIYDI
jgi:hypothetical protein